MSPPSRYALHNIPQGLSCLLPLGRPYTTSPKVYHVSSLLVCLTQHPPRPIMSPPSRYALHNIPQGLSCLLSLISLDMVACEACIVLSSLASLTICMYHLKPVLYFSLEVGMAFTTCHQQLLGPLYVNLYHYTVVIENMNTKKSIFYMYM